MPLLCLMPHIQHCAQNYAGKILQTLTILQFVLMNLCVVLTVINESSRAALECALRCDCIAKTETGKFESAV